MAKPTTEVNKNLLQQAIDQAESNGPLKNLDALWKAACAIYNRMSVPKQITFSVVALRAKAWSLQTKTKPGKKGRLVLSDEQKAAMQAARGKRVSRSVKFASRPDVVNGFVELRRIVPARFQPLVDKLINNGSMKAAVHLYCLDCTAYQPAEIKLCTCNDCPLFAFRPYSKIKVESESTEEELEEQTV